MYITCLYNLSSKLICLCFKKWPISVNFGGLFTLLQSISVIQKKNTGGVNRTISVKTDISNHFLKIKKKLCQFTNKNSKGDYVL